MNGTDRGDGAAPWAAAILNDGARDIDAFLAEIVAGERARGRKMQGMLMTYPDRGAGCASAMVLVDIATNESYLVSQALGSGSSSCRADTQGFARASEVFRRALAAPGGEVDLVVCNRFGELEAAGGGFSAELLELMAGGVPLLTVVAPRFRDAWTRFTGGATLLPVDAAAVHAWIDAALAARADAS
ncbi:MAG: DUF2478 domain-containing protein [Burkholderiales bacterium]